MAKAYCLREIVDCETDGLCQQPALTLFGKKQRNDVETRGLAGRRKFLDESTIWKSALLLGMLENQID